MNAANFIAAIWGLLLARPQLLADHMGGYAALMYDEAMLVATYLRYQLCLWVTLIMCAGLFLGLFGMALMMWATTSNSTLVNAWVFILVPAIPLFGAIGAWIALHQEPPSPLLNTLRGQIAADFALLNTHVN